MSDLPGVPKRVDESWKSQVEREKQGAPPSKANGPSKPSASGREAPTSAAFTHLVSSVSMQAMMFLGEVPNPMTGQAETDLEQARSLIDMVGMLKEKTQGNLNAEEEKLLSGVLFELRTKFVERSKVP
ncbi:MAG: DUF1844 domain-containing protein [Candidatus Omnitrophica bacterium]|nr:DUF1844 domain-containing protein [Candidatus Omnitrophota bacterium]